LVIAGEGAMTIEIELKVEKVEITHDAPMVGTEKGDRADVHLIIKAAGFGRIPLTLHIFGYASLDDAIEKARQAVFAFADALAKVADQRPLK
jgi:hypothetical protein